MDVNKIMRSGSLFFTIVLFTFSSIKYLAGSNKTSAYFLIAALGFFIVYLSYRKKQKHSR